MVTEVENILREIRERVQAEEEQNGSVAKRSAPASDVPAHVTLSDEVLFRDGDSLACVSSHLTTTARTWDKLPPLISTRKGAAARFELWIKARLKVMSRWFTWEQVNFNSAVHHALTDVLQTLTSQAHELGRLQSDLLKENEAWKAGLERESQTLHAELESRGNTRAAETNTRLSEIRAEMNARLMELAQQISASQQHLHEQQRVCFEQLSLEVGEAARREDRHRSAVESRLENLEKESSGSD